MLVVAAGFGDGAAATAGPTDEASAGVGVGADAAASAGSCFGSSFGSSFGSCFRTGMAGAGVAVEVVATVVVTGCAVDVSGAEVVTGGKLVGELLDTDPSLTGVDGMDLPSKEWSE